MFQILNIANDVLIRHIFMHITSSSQDEYLN
jgi:hypothetical protein